MKFSMPMQEENNNNNCDKHHNILPFSYDYLSSTEILFLEENNSSISSYHSPTFFFLSSFLYPFCTFISFPLLSCHLFLYLMVNEFHILPLLYLKTI